MNVVGACRSGALEREKKAVRRIDDESRANGNFLFWENRAVAGPGHLALRWPDSFRLRLINCPCPSVHFFSSGE